MPRIRLGVLPILSLLLLLAACGQPLTAPVPSEDQPSTSGSVKDSTTVLTPLPGSNALTDGGRPAYARNGSGPVETNASNGGPAAGDGHHLTLNGSTYPKGFGVHANSQLNFNLPRSGLQCSTFQSDIGVDDEVGALGSVVFKVMVDGVVKFDSGKLTGASATKQVKLNIAGAKQLTLLVTDAGDGVRYDHADWANPIITCAKQATTPPPSPTPAPTPTPTPPPPPPPPSGRLDPSFDADGIVRVPLADLNGNDSFQSSRAFDVLGQQDSGQIVAVTYNGLFRFAVNGSRDRNFGNGGVARVSDLTTPKTFALQPNGGILMADITGAGAVRVARFTADGQTDSAFGSGGSVSVNVGAVPGFAQLTVQTDNKFLVAAAVADQGGSSSWRVQRFNPGGVTDASFGSGNGVTTNVAPANSSLNVTSVQVQSDGAVLVAGSFFSQLNGPSTSAVAVTRYTALGQTDGTYGTGGKITLVPPGFFGMSVQGADLAPDNKLVIAGQASSATQDVAAALRLTTSGTLDASFGTGGVQTLAPFQEARSVTAQPDSKLLVSLAAYPNYRFARLNANGSPDTTFGNGGSADFGLPSAVPVTSIVQRDGKIVVSLYETDKSADLARLTP